ncbi:hypothetical protein [Streptomyces silvensis]|uniref:hypothetical protein n=1 Tax=Streptomyces silvensis TaxID=1765722 RepID=UPI00099EA623|nr:hypothetical protein [Streptomyces silvensis]
MSTHGKPEGDAVSGGEAAVSEDVTAVSEGEAAVSEGEAAVRANGAAVSGDGAAAAPRPWWHWRRLSRGRWRPALAAAVVGALLGGTGVAWQAEAGPFGRERACWGAFDEDDVADLFHGKRDIKSSEVGVSYDRIASDGPSGACELLSPRGHRVRARLHQLDVRFAGAGDKWADEFLSARMTPIGGGFLGMVSDTRAWLAVPEGCVGRNSDREGPLVFDMEAGWTTYDDVVDTGERARLARAVVTLVNDYMAGRGCDSPIPDPTARLAAPARFLDEKRDAICGVEGLRLPGGDRESRFERPLVTGGTAAPVRTCDRDVLFGHPRLRLMTVEDPRLALIYKGLSYDGGRRVTAAGDTGDQVRGRGFLRDDMGLFQASCQTGEVTFLVRAADGGRAADVRRLLPRYAALEADRLGCGPLRLRLPS